MLDASKQKELSPAGPSQPSPVTSEGISQTRPPMPSLWPPAHSCPPQNPSVLSQSQGLSWPRPREPAAKAKEEQNRGKGEVAEDTAQMQDRKRRHQADTSATVRSTLCTGLSSDPARSYFLPAAQNSWHILRAAGHPTRDADSFPGH